MKTKLIKNIVLNDIVDVEDIDNVKIVLSNGACLDAECNKKVGEKVIMGEKVAEPAKDMLGVPIHSSICGTIAEVNINQSKLNKNVSYITIKGDGKKTNAKKLPQIKDLTLTALQTRLQQAGIVGCGGAGFPAYAKLKSEVEYKAIVVNACVSDYLTTADLAVLYHNFEDVLSGVEILQKLFYNAQAYIVVNKFAKEILKDKIHKMQNEKIAFYFMPNKYGQGDESVICKKIFGYNKAQSFPAYDGILVYNAQTVYQIQRAVNFGEVVTNRVVTICGKPLYEAKNYRVPIGADVQDVIKKYGNLICDYTEYEQREQATMEKFMHLQDLRSELKEKREDSEFIANFVDERKETNAMIFDFLKYERLNKKHLAKALFVGGKKYGKIINDYCYNVQKTTYCIEYLTEKQSIKRKDRR